MTMYKCFCFMVPVIINQHSYINYKIELEPFADEPFSKPAIAPDFKNSDSNQRKYLSSIYSV